MFVSAFLALYMQPRCLSDFVKLLLQPLRNLLLIDRQKKFAGISGRVVFLHDLYLGLFYLEYPFVFWRIEVSVGSEGFVAEKPLNSISSQHHFGIDVEHPVGYPLIVFGDLRPDIVQSAVYP